MSAHPFLMLAVVAAALALFAVLAVLGSVAWGQQRADFNRRVERQLRDLFISINPAKLWMLQCVGALAVAALAAVITWNPVTVGLSAVLAMTLPHFAMVRLQHLRRQKLRRQIPDLLMLIAGCLLYTSPSPRDRQKSRMPSSA